MKILLTFIIFVKAFTNLFFFLENILFLQYKIHKNVIMLLGSQYLLYFDFQSKYMLLTKKNVSTCYFINMCIFVWYISAYIFIYNSLVV